MAQHFLIINGLDHLGKCLTEIETEIEINFTIINLGPPLIYLSQEIIKDLSTDQSYAYQIC